MTVSATTVTQYYTGIFRQAPSAAVSSAYQAMATDSAALNSMLSAANVTVDPVVRLYQTAFNRLPDTNGMTAWVVPFSTGQISLQFIANGFTQSTEFTTLYPTSMSNSQFVGALYWNILQRAGEDAGIKGWTNALDSGALTRAQVLLGFSESAEFTAKIEPNVNTFLTNIALTPVANQGSANLYAGSLFDQGTGALTTYNLTTGVDTISGSNIAVNGVVDFGGAKAPAVAGTTYNTADTITGTGGTNVLTVTLTNAATGAINAMNSPAVSGMNTVNIRNVSTQDFFATGAGAYNVANFGTGVTSINADRSLNNIFLQGIAATTAVGITGNGVITNGDLEAGYKAGATSATLNVSGGTTAGAVAITGADLLSASINSNGLVANKIGTVSIANATTININATSGLTTGAITAAAATTYKIGGAGAVNIAAGALAGTVTSIDASANTGGVTIALGSAVTQKYVGSAGNDVVTTGALVLTTGSIDGGAGTADVLDIAGNSGNVATAALGAKYSNFEILRTSGTVNMANLGSSFTGIQLSGTGASITNMTAAQAASVQARADIGATTLTLATATGTSDVLNIQFGAAVATTDAATNAGVLTVTGFETLNLSTNAGSAATTGTNRTTTVTGAIVDTSLTAVNLTGTAFKFTDASSTKAVTWDATALTGDGASTPVGLTLDTGAGMATGSLVKGSGVRDVITISAAVGSTFQGNAGNDIFSTTSTILTPTGATTDVTVDGGVGTNDNITLTAASVLTDTSFSKTTNMESLTLVGGNNSESVTGLAANAANAFATGITVTETAAQTNNAVSYTWASGLYNQNVTLTHATAYTGAATGGNQSITTGGGTDTITFTGSAWVGTAGAGGTIVIATGAGNDTINVTTGTLAANTNQAIQITGGTGADVINLTHVNANAALGNALFVVAAGDSTTTAYDSITGFKVGVAATTISDGIDVAGTATLTTYAATAATGYSAAELTVAVSNVGAVTFAGTAASGLTLAQKISAVQSVVVTNNGDMAYFANGGNTYVFSNNSAGDTVVELVGVTGVTSLITTNATTGNAIFVA